MTSLHQRLTLYASGSDTYTFVPTDSSAQSLSIHRNEGDIILNPPNTPVPALRGQTVFGILGLISLSMSEYMIVITKRTSLGRLMGQDVYRATDFDILPLSPHVNIAHPQHPVESHLVGLVKTHLRTGFFLFSYGFDLTRRLQAQWETREQDAGKAMWEVADDRFFWNKFLHTRFMDITTNTRQDLSPYILPVIYGSFDANPCTVNGHPIQLCLISRRSRYRAGTRYFKRGVDHEGHVANFNETEQIVTVIGPGAEDNSQRMSFVQIRGSIPIFWAEINTLRYVPDLQIMDLQDTADALKLHLQDQVERYGAASLVNLINHKGHEKPIKEAYEKYMSQVTLPNVRYEYFDFHAECSRMRWNRISILLENMEEDLVTQGYFHLDSNSEPVKLQKGVIRTNCMDNLDRTNVTQAAFALWNLGQQLKAIGVLKEKETVAEHLELTDLFRIMWANHADHISIAYAGTPALKTDFTRTGKRTRRGALEDFSKSAMRYLRNNFFDGTRQDGFDLMTGAFVPRRGPSSSLALVTDSRPLLIRSMPFVAWFSLFMVFAGITLPRTSAYSLLYYFLLWLFSFAGALVFILLHGTEYVAWPRLVPPLDVLTYVGPGFRARFKGSNVGVPVIDAKRARWMEQGRRRAEARIEEIEMGTKKRRD